MSTIIKTIDLSSYGCPMHYIKAREALGSMALEDEVLLVVNNGEAVEKVITSLRHDGHICEIESEDTLTITIRVTKKT